MHFESHKQLSTLSAAIPVLVVALYRGFDLDAFTAVVFLVACAVALYASLLGMLLSVSWSGHDVPLHRHARKVLFGLMFFSVCALGIGVSSLLLFLLVWR
jgi:hypothetical protein